MNWFHIELATDGSYKTYFVQEKTYEAACAKIGGAIGDWKLLGVFEQMETVKKAAHRIA